MRVLQNVVETFHFLRSESQLTLFSVECRLGSKTHNDFFAVYGRKYGYTDVVFQSVNHLCNTAVLRFSLFRDIHTADNLDTCGQCRHNLDIVFALFIQGTVNTVADTNRLFHRLDMYIGSSLTGCLFNHFLNQDYDRGIVDVFINFFINGVITEFFLRILLQCGCHFIGTVKFIDCHHYASRSCNQRLYLAAGDNGDVIHCIDIQRIRHGYTQDIDIVLCKFYRQNL